MESVKKIIKQSVKSIRFLHKKKVFFLLPLFPVILVFIQYTPTGLLSILHNTDKPYEFTTYCDGGEGGQTTITPAVYNDTSLSFQFTLQKGAPYPYAGVTVDLMKDSSFLDLSKYNYMIIDLQSNAAESFAVYLKAFIDGFTELDKQFTQEFLTKEITVDNSTSRYKIYFKEFIHPQWWLEQSKVADNFIGSPHTSKIMSMQIQNGLLTPFYSPVSIVVKEIAFGRDVTHVYRLLLAFIAFYYLFYVIIYKIAQSRRRVVISYKELEVENDADNDMKRIASCVAKNYSDPAFSVEKLAREAGVSASKIPGMLKERFNLNFKQYLNTIRITEAKRLLRETDNQIVTLAYTVGYNNIPHFNRTFKQFEGISPKEYRKKHKSDSTD